jgi:hypothetical protein
MIERNARAKARSNWRARASLEDIGMPTFSLEYHADHSDYDFNEGHYHIEITLGCFLRARACMGNT